MYLSQESPRKEKKAKQNKKQNQQIKALNNYSDVNAMASQIIGNLTVWSTACAGIINKNNPIS